MEQANDIEEKVERYEELRQMVPLLEALDVAEGQLDEAREKLSASQTALDKCQEKANAD